MKEKYDVLFEKERLLSLARELKREHFKPGYDNLTAESTETWIEINYDNLFVQLKESKYQPIPLLGFSVIKKNGRFRRLTKPSAPDMILQRTIADYLTEPFYRDNIHAYRPSKRTVSSDRNRNISVRA